MMTSVFRTQPLLRRVAPRLSKEFFTCHSPHAAASQARIAQTRTPLELLGRSLAHRKRGVSVISDGAITTKPVPSTSNLSTSIFRTTQGSAHSQRFPETSEKIVAYWLLGSAASVFGIVVFGGLTRLTESGLSITEWRPVTGSLPPMNDQDWNAEFDKYRASPEFKMLNPNMTLDEFKSIYYMEWTHRLWGRFVGLSFVIPAIYFIARRKTSSSMAFRVAGIAGLIGLQGALGWWMVKSGLKDDLFNTGSHPRVSQYRLVAHLGTAFLCYSAMLWNGLAILREHRYLADPAAAEKTFRVLKSPELKVFRRSVAALAVLVFCTAMSGGLVAGLDAGLIYNEFPYMGTGLTPPRSELFSEFYSHRQDKSDLWWRNILENPSLVQLDHRILATTTFTSVMALQLYSRLAPSVKRVMPAACRKGIHRVVGLAWLQVILGISTLLYLVPVPLASAHQAGSLALLSSVLVLGGRTWVPQRISMLVSGRLRELSSRAVRPNKVL